MGSIWGECPRPRSLGEIQSDDDDADDDDDLTLTRLDDIEGVWGSSRALCASFVILWFCDDISGIFFLMCLSHSHCC